MDKIRQVPKNTKVYFTHKRKFSDDFLEPRGGYTQARLVRDGKLIATGEAFCGKRDNFSKRIGRDISLGRALKTLEGSKKL